MRTCIFCGSVQIVTYRNIPLSHIENIIASQKAANIDCVVLNLTETLVAYARRQVGISVEEETETGVKTDKDSSAEIKNTYAVATTCMCCHHWVTRRMQQAVVPLPMQSLLWFLTCLRSCENKRCDIRVLVRMARTISTSKDNMYRSVFESTQVDFMARLTRAHANMPKHSIELVKAEFARFWHAQNGHTLLLPSAAVAELLRATPGTQSLSI